MRLHSIQTVGVEGVADGEYAFVDASGRPADVVVVSGPSASGKTRFVELLLLVREQLAPSNDEGDPEAWVRLGGRSARVLTTFWLDEHERAKLGYAEPTVTTETILLPDPDLVADVEPDAGLCFLLDAYDHTDGTIKFEHFGENRRLDVGGGAASLGVDAQKKLRTSKDPRKYAFVPSFVASLKADPARADRFRALLAAFSPSCGYDAATGRLSTSGRPIAGYDELSATETDALLFASVASLVTLARSVVIVDRPDLYIRDEARLAQGLSQLGPSNQIFVATPSADLFRAAPSRCAIVLG